MISQDHPGTVQLINFSSGLPLETELREHIAACPTCQRAIELLQAEERQEVDRLSPEQTLAALRERAAARGESGSGRRIRWIPLGAAAVAAALLVVAAVVTLTGSEDPDRIRLKGGLGVQVYLNREGQTIEVEPETKFRQGDRIRLGVLSKDSASVTVSARDGEQFVPIRDLSGIDLVPGEEKVLPGSLLLGCEARVETLELEITFGPGVKRSPERRTVVLGCEKP